MTVAELAESVAHIATIQVRACIQLRTQVTYVVYFLNSSMTESASDAITLLRRCR